MEEEVTIRPKRSSTISPPSVRLSSSYSEPISLLNLQTFYPTNTMYNQPNSPPPKERTNANNQLNFRSLEEMKTNNQQESLHKAQIPVISPLVRVKTSSTPTSVPVTENFDLKEQRQNSAVKSSSHGAGNYLCFKINRIIYNHIVNII